MSVKQPITGGAAIDGEGGPAAPSRVGKYRVDGVIGRGAMGVVYRGFDPDIERTVAIKTLRRDVLDELDRGALLQRFAAEAKAAGRCAHPNIVAVFDYVEQDAAPHLIMEFVDAGTLETVIRSGSTPPLAQVADIMGQLLSALDHAHGHGVVHRDVKPSNILCPTAETIKITDFGVARFDGLGVTRPGMAGALGTPNYMAPEQFLGRVVDGRADIFAAGVILFQLLTGARPFVAVEAAELMQKLLNDTPPHLSSYRADAPEALNDLVQHALARNPEDRFPTAAAFAEALRQVAARADEDGRPRLDLTEIARTRPGVEEGTPSNRLGASPSTTLGRTMADRLTPDSFSELEAVLARSIGPIAKTVLKRAAQRATDADNLLSTLADQIPSPVEATAFRQKAASAIRARDEMTGMRLEASISEAQIAAATAALTPIIGPMAKIMAKKTAATAIGHDDFLTRLAATIPTESDRATFLAKARGGG